MLSFNSTLMDELERGYAEPVIWVKLELHTTGDVAATFNFVNNPESYLVKELGYTPLISNITAVGSSVDPIERTYTSAEIAISLIDDGPGGIIRAMVEGHYIRNKKITLAIGTTSMTSTTNFENVWIGSVADIEPTEGIITLNCKPRDIPDTMIDEITIGWHPLEAVYNIMRYNAGWPAALLDSTSLAYDYDTDKSHYCLKRRGEWFSSGSTHTKDNLEVTNANRAWTGTITVVDVTGLLGSGDTITITECTTDYTGTDYVQREGIEWAVSPTEALTAINIRDAINAGPAACPNCTATCSGNVVTITRDSTGGNEGFRYLHISTDSDPANIVVAETDIFDYIQFEEISGNDREVAGVIGSNARQYLFPRCGSSSPYDVLLYHTPSSGTAYEATIREEDYTQITMSDGTPLASDKKCAIFPTISGETCNLAGKVILKAGLRPFKADTTNWLTTGAVKARNAVYGDMYSIKDFVTAMAYIMEGFIFIKPETGKLTAHIFDGDAASSATLTKDDIFDLKQHSSTGNVYNRINANFEFDYWIRKKESDGTYSTSTVEFGLGDTKSYTFTHNDTTAQQRFAADGATSAEGISALDIASEWCCGVGALQDTGIASGSVSMRMDEGTLYANRHIRNIGITGTGDIDNHPSNRQITSSRQAYFLIDNEIILATSQTKSNVGDRMDVYSPGQDTTIEQYEWADMTYVISRGAKGTVAAKHAGGSLVYDITIPVRMSSRSNRGLAERFSYGAPVLKFYTNLSFIELEINDLIKIEHDLYLTTFRDGLTTGDVDKWQIIGKTLHIDTGRIEWEVIKAITIKPSGE